MKQEKLYKVAIENECKSVKGEDVQHAPFVRIRFVGNEESIKFIANMFTMKKNMIIKNKNDMKVRDSREKEIKDTIMMLIRTYPLYKEFINADINIQDNLEFAATHINSKLLKNLPTVHYLDKNAVETVLRYINTVKNQVSFRNVEDDIDDILLDYEITRAFSNIVEKDTFEYAQKIAEQELIEGFNQYAISSSPDVAEFKECLNQILTDLSNENILNNIWDTIKFPTVVMGRYNVNEAALYNESPYIVLPSEKMETYSHLEINIVGIDVVPIKLMLLMLMKVHSEIENSVIIGNIEYVGQDDKPKRYVFEPITYTGEICDMGEVNIGENTIRVMREGFSRNALLYFIKKTINTLNHTPYVEVGYKERVAKLFKDYGYKISKNECLQLGIKVDREYVKTFSIFKKDKPVITKGIFKRD